MLKSVCVIEFKTEKVLWMKLKMGPEMRYGKALFDLSNEHEKAGISGLAATLTEALSTGDELSSILKSQSVTKVEKNQVLQKLLDGLKADALFANFVALMCEKGRANCLLGALQWFKFYEDAASGVVKAFVKTAEKLSAAQKKSIEEFVKSNVQEAKSVELTEEVDASLVAGLRVRIGSVEYDMSVRGRLDGLRTSLI